MDSNLTETILKDWLVREMSDISEEHWCAGWLVGLEYSLWRCIQDAEQGKLETVKWGDREVTGVSFGMEVIPKEKLFRMRDVARLVNGWFIWDGNSEKFVSMEEWLKLYSSWEHNRG